MRVQDDGLRLVEDRVAGEQHAPRPLVVLAHDQVLGERELAEELPRDRGVHVREVGRLEVHVGGSVDPLHARVRPVHELPVVALGRWGGIERDVPAVDAGGVRARAQWRDERAEPAVVGRIRVLAREDECVPLRELGPEVAGTAVVELLGLGSRRPAHRGGALVRDCHRSTPSRRRRPRPRRRPAGCGSPRGSGRGHCRRP